MTFHADFWVVAGTAAPVIALSSILVNGDQAQLLRELERATGKKLKSTSSLKWPSEFYFVVFSSMLVSVITMLQTAVLSISLASLAQESNYASPSLVIAFEFFSLFLLGVTTLTLVNQKNQAKAGVGQANNPPLPGPKISRRPPRQTVDNPSRRAFRYRSAHQVASNRGAHRANSSDAEV